MDELFGAQGNEQHPYHDGQSCSNGEGYRHGLEFTKRKYSVLTSKIEQPSYKRIDKKYKQFLLHDLAVVERYIYW